MLRPLVSGPLEPRHNVLATDHEPALASVLNLLYDRKATIAIFIAAALGIAAAYLLASPKYYSAAAQMLVDTHRSPAVATNSDYAVDTAVVESQVQTIKSENIAVAVVQKLGLTNDTEFADPGMLSQILESIGLGSPATEDAAEVKLQTALTRFRRGLNVSRVGLSYAVDISFSANDPQKAARIANTVADAYIDDQLNARTLNTQRANSWILGRIDELRLKAASATRTLDSFKAEHNIAGDDLSRLDGEQLAQFRQLESTAQTYKRSYETFVNLDRFSRTSQEQTYPVTEARVLTPASPPTGSSSPKVGLTLFAALMTGCGLGLLTALAREQLDPTIRTRSHLERRLGVRSLGFIPIVRSPSSLMGFRQLKSKGALVSFFTNGQASTEALKTLRRVMAAIDDCNRSCSIIGITSPNSGEGTTTIAFNLARLIADAEKRVLLIDGNFHNPSLTNMVGYESQRGQLRILNWLTRWGRQSGTQEPTMNGEATLGGAVLSRHAGFCFLPQSPRPASPPADGAPTPTSMQELLSEARSSYDCVIVDFPSILEYANASTTAKLLDALVLVASWGDTTLEEIEQSIGSSHFVYERLLGIVVNNASFPKGRRRRRVNQRQAASAPLN
jgi:polysaccharide biosynthesis transport protein